MLETFRLLFHKGSSTGARSTALHPLQWFMGLLIAGLVLSVFAHAPTWMMVTLAVLVCVAALFFLGAYAVFMKVDRDALRSEAFAIEKIAIEKGIYGDSETGTFEQKFVDGSLALPAPDETSTADEKE